MIDRIASLVSLAKMERMSLDLARPESRVGTASYAAILDAFIELAEPEHHKALAATAALAVRERMEG